MQEPRNLSWTHYNKARRFPLMFDSTAVSRDGLFTIPDDLIVSLYLSCNVSGTHDDPRLFYIGGLTYYHTGFVLEVFYGAGDAGQKVAETTVDLAVEKIPKVVQLLGLDPMILSGMLVLGDIEGLSRQNRWVNGRLIQRRQHLTRFVFGMLPRNSRNFMSNHKGN